ncbi:MAG: single-stranded DNA-binding protein [Agathobacter sp.]|nr:single-stranded DNA-binding protein [Agathobacter sp.]
MVNNQTENNQVTLVGHIASGFTFSHEVYGEGFYLLEVDVKRLSGATDKIPVMVSERLVDVSQEYCGEAVYLIGQFRSFNKQGENKKHLMLYVFAREFLFLDKPDAVDEQNHIILDGYICKEVLYRKTPQDREIADVLVAVNRSYGKSDYIPCIIWGRNAQFIANFPAGTHVQLWGRVQSREYLKRKNENETEQRVAYEVSVSKVNLP